MTVLTPYAFLLGILIQSVSLPGAMAGIEYMFVPEWSKLANYEVRFFAGDPLNLSHEAHLDVDRERILRVQNI